jgi:hypothetical protein
MRRGVTPRFCGGLLLVALLGLSCAAAAAAAAPPPNDDFANAQSLSGALPIEVSDTNVGATAQSGEPRFSSASGGHTIWFRWQAPSSGAVTVSTCGSEMPTFLGVYIGNSVNALSEVASTTRDWPGCVFEEGTQATFTAVVGRVYSIQVDGNTYHEGSQSAVSGEGAIKLQVHDRPPPENDDLADAKTIQVGSGGVPAPNFGATKEPGEPDHRGNPGGASVWFKFTAPKTEGVWIQTQGGKAGHESLVAVYTGSSVDDLTRVPGVESWGEDELAFPAVGGVTYRIAVDGQYDPNTGTAFMDEPEISLSNFTGNDDFADAFGLGNWPFGGTFGEFFLGNVGATKEPGEPNHAGNRGGASVWFTWSPEENGSAGLNVCGADFHTLLAVYTGSSLPSLVPVAAASSPQGPSCNSFGSDSYQVNFNADAGTTYRIAVDGYEGAWGSFGLELHTSKDRLASSRPSPRSDPAPQTEIVGRHLNRRRHVAVFHLRASAPGSHFFCKLDRRPFVACGPTVTYRRLRRGRHDFKAKAVSPEGVPDPTPAVFRFVAGQRR